MMRRWFGWLLGGGERGSPAPASTQPPEPPAPPSELELGLAAHQAGDLVGAARHYRARLEETPDDAHALHLLGALLAQRGEPAEALVLLERAVALDEADAALRVDHGNVCMLLGRAAEAAEGYRRATAIEPGNAMAWGNLAGALHGLGRPEEAVAACRQALEHAAPGPDGLASLARTLRVCGGREDAERACHAALDAAPGHADARLVLGLLLLDRGAHDGALEHFRAVVAAQPHDPFAHGYLGTALERVGDIDAALAACSRAVELAPNEPETHAALAGVMWRARRLEAAVRQYRRAVELAPERLEPRANLAALLESISRLEEAASEARAGLAQHPADPLLNLTAARCERRAGAGSAALARLERLDASRAMPDLQARIGYEIGQLRDAAGDTDGAMAALREANAIAAASPEARSADPQRYLDEIAAARAIVPRLAGLANLHSSPAVDESPAFVVGFPRSGTTLSDQILDSHPGVRTLSEKPAVDKVVDWLAQSPAGYPAALSGLSEEELTALRGTYDAVVESFVKLAPGELLVDRYPLNLARLPAVWRLFPRARIVLALRHPCDVVLSCYMQHFALNDAMASFLDLQDTARLYDAVMGLWRECVEHLHLEVHVLRYESLVEDFEAEVRTLLEFLGLPWSDAVLDFASHARARGDINTPSYHQVTRGIYTDARERWRRYAGPLAPVLPVLAPWAEHFGYTMDVQ
jgi:Flp pilus assembly protein TadD